MPRVCLHCGKSQKSLSGFQQHRKACKGINRRASTPMLIGQNVVSSHNETGHPIPTWEPLAEVRHVSSLGQETLEGYNKREQRQERYNPEINEDSRAEAPLTMDWEHSPNFSDQSAVQTPSTNLSQALESRHSSMTSRTLTFQEATGKSAGLPLEMWTQRLKGSSNRQGPNHNCGFESNFDTFFATWLRSSGVSKGNVDKLLRDARAKPLNTLLSFENGNEWHQKVESLSSGMKHFWTKAVIPVEARFRDQENVEYVALYQDVIEAVRFLLSHPPFADNLVYAPVRHLDMNDSPIYSEMHTAEWWWETQLLLPDNATLVPLLLATDKTLLSQHQGDVTAWPVYLTIGNLDRRTRRSQLRPGQVLLGFLPVLPKYDDETRAIMWHKVIGMMLQRSAIRDIARDGIEITCADGETRQCYLIIGGFSADTEEQFLITGVKNGQHCTICTVPANEREDLELESPPRTHASTQQQIKTQLERNTKKSDKDWVHPIENFAWEHAYVNIHEAMMLDPLHQLYKGMIGQHLRSWVLQEITAAVKAERKRKGITTTDEVLNADAKSRLDERFRRVPKCENLIVFRNYSDRKQWTGLEDRNLLRQFIPVITPLLLSTAPDVLQLARALVDFILLATYVSHNAETLQYLRLALYRMNRFKYAVNEYRPKGQFNFPKFHVMRHYPDFIRKYGAADNFDTEHSESSHKFHVKAFYPLTNKQDGYLEQIIMHSIRRLNSVASEDQELYSTTSLSNITSEQTEAHVTPAAREILLHLIPGLPLKKEKQYVKRRKLNPQYWCTALALANVIEVPKFLDSLALFVRQQRSELSETLAATDTTNGLEEDISWVESLLVCVHGSLKCWSRKGKDAVNLEKLDSHHVRCKPKWRGSASWRRDWVLVQETLAELNHSDVLKGRLPGQLKIIISVQDTERKIPGTHKLMQYTGALIEVLRPRNGGKVHEVHGMIEVERWPSTASKNHSNTSNFCFYTIPTILRSVHLFPASLTNDKVFFINNYFDWDTYNTFYDPDFEAKERRAASWYNPTRAKKEKAKKRDEAWIQETDEEENGETEDDEEDDEEASSGSDSTNSDEADDDDDGDHNHDEENESEAEAEGESRTAYNTRRYLLRVQIDKSRH